jgi:Spy/CpxP family protein refolding chaperone
MRLLLSVVLAGGSLVFAIAALAQSTATPTVPINPAAAMPVAGGKRFACQAASREFKGQEQKDQMQLCMAQARVDCLKQAIDQKIIGPQRRDFVKNCVQDVPAK